MKTVKEKYLLVGADFAGYPLKEAVVAHLKRKGWKITDVGVTDPDTEDTEMMFHRVGLRVGSMIAEGEFERALIFCGTGMGIHIAGQQVSPCTCGRRRERTGSVTGDYGQWCERAGDGSVLCSAADGVRYCGCLSECRAGQWIRVVA